MLRSWRKIARRQFDRGTRQSRHGFRKSKLNVEYLEARDVPAVAQPSYELYWAGADVAPWATAAPSGYSPAQARHAYGFDQIVFSGGTVGDGSGQTIAIVDANDDPKIASDLHAFDVRFGLPDPVFTK